MITFFFGGVEQQPIYTDFSYDINERNEDTSPRWSPPPIYSWQLRTPSPPPSQSNVTVLEDSDSVFLDKPPSAHNVAEHTIIDDYEAEKEGHS